MLYFWSHQESLIGKFEFAREIRFNLYWIVRVKKLLINIVIIWREFAHSITAKG